MLFADNFMKRLLYIVPVLVLAFGGCKKHDLPQQEDSGEPVFYAKADVNGTSNAINVQAGVDGYYMTAGHFQNADNVYVYQGDLNQKSCNGNCGYGISVEINDYKVSAVNETMKPDSGLFVGSYEFNDGNLEPLGYNGTFTPNYTLSLANNWQWQYSDGALETYTVPHNSVHYFRNHTKHTVTLKIDNGSTPIELSNTFKIGSSLQANIKIDKTIPADFTFSVMPTTTASNFYWEYGDGNTSQLSQPYPFMSHSYVVTTGPGTFVATVHTSNATDTCVSNVFVYGWQGEYNANFTNTFTPVPNSKKLSAVTIKVTDPNGKVFSSDASDQPSSSNFQILSIESYKANSAGDNTRKVKIKFSCVVKNGNESLNISNGEAVMAVSYK
jgi:hypothetical protein